jgi:hypothetical protein
MSFRRTSAPVATCPACTVGRKKVILLAEIDEVYIIDLGLASQL